MPDYDFYHGLYSGQQVDSAVARALAGGQLDQDIAAIRAAVGSPLVANTAAEMTNINKIYVYTGSEAGYATGHWYYYEGGSWQDGGLYNSAAADSAMSDSSTNAVQNKIIKAYVDTEISEEQTRAEGVEALKAPLASPAFTGTPTAPTAAAGTANTQIATTAYADNAVAVEKARAEAAEALLAPLASPALTGNPTAPTQAALDNSTKISTTAYADAAVSVEKARAEAVEATKANLDAYPHDTASGSVSSFTDGADNIPVRSLTAQIVPVQSGSGDPSPVNQRPISGWTGTRIVRSSSANAVDPVANAVEQGGIASADGQDTQTETRLRTKGFIPVKPLEQYTASWTADAGSGVGLQAYWYFYGEDKGFLRNGGSWTGSGAVSGNGTVMIDSDVRYVRFLFRKFGDSSATLTADMVTSLQLEIGSTATSYQPGSAATEKVISWQSAAGTVYGGTLTDNGDGTWTLTKTMVGVDLGTLTWTYDSDSGAMVAAYTSSLPLKTGSSHNPCICEIYKTDVSAIDFYSSDDVACINNGRRTSQQTIQVRDSAYTDADAFKAAMDGIMFVYDMATPQTYTITADSVRTLLGANNIFADTGDVSVDYRADTKLYIDGKVAALTALISEL